MDPRGTSVITGGGRGGYGGSGMWPDFAMNVSANSYDFSADQMPIGHELIQHSLSPCSKSEHCERDGASGCNSNGGNNSSFTVLKNGGGKPKAVELNGVGGSKAGEEMNSVKEAGKSSEPAESSKQDYIHVRARRGQATDSHSLAERARREKISERMKILQDLVPGCNKVIGKALVLDEIINYIQSLQRQVEFLSMKLEAVNSRLGVEQSKEFCPQTFMAPGVTFGSHSGRDYGGGSASSPEWLQMQIGGGFERIS